MTKLNKRKVKWLVDQIVKNKKRPSDVAQVYGISERRAQQLAKFFRETKKYPEIMKNRRPKTQLSTEQKSAIDKAYLRTKYTPIILYHELKFLGTPVPKNKMYKYMKAKCWIKNEPKKQKQRKRCRYERKHSGSLIHGDFHRTTENHPHCILWLDDASRKIVAGAEIKSANTEIAIKTFQKAIEHFKKFDATIKQANTDRGTQFYNSKFNKNGTRQKSEFELFLEKQGIEFIPSRRNNPQTNGKIERRWREYDKHRWQFSSLQEWIDWHNNRLTTALNMKAHETPETAFCTKLPNLFALFWKRWQK